jgi:histidinol-phosphate aminotransferase
LNKHIALARPDILTLKPYEHAVWNPNFERLHANENPWRSVGDPTVSGLNRYPECPPDALNRQLATIYGVPPEQLIVGRGSDESIDLLCRTFCRAGIDSVLICPPTFGFYKVAAKVQGADVIEVPLRADFSLDRLGVIAAWREGVKLLFLCSPGNPTGNSLAVADIHAVCEAMEDKAIVVVDEAYIEFAQAESLTKLLPRYSNLVVLRTLSKAYGLAGARCGAAIADRGIIELLERVLPPYAVPTSTIESVLAVTTREGLRSVQSRVETLIEERRRLAASLMSSPLISRVHPSDANFLLVECVDADRVLVAAQHVGLVLRDQRGQSTLRNCLRITVGTPDQNSRLIDALASSAGAAA